jgi:hypothetical protein
MTLKFTITCGGSIPLPKIVKIESFKKLVVSTFYKNLVWNYQGKNILEWGTIEFEKTNV